ncbi:MAG: LysR family transcriptional regulator [Reyranellaceae bacterium]
MDRLDELAIFVHVVEGGSLAGAARRLRRSPPAVTRALAALEARVGQRLVERTTRRLATTEAGRALYERARGLLADYEAATGPVAVGPVQGLLRLSAPVQFGRRHMAPIVGRFLDEHEAVEVELVLNDRTVDLVEEGIDVALRIGELAASSLSALAVGHVRRLWVASPSYLERRGAPARPADLVSHEALLGTSPGNGEWRFAGGRRGAAPRLSGRLRVDDVETRLRAARDGRGIAQLLSYQVADDLASGRLIRLLEPFEPSPLPVHLVTSGRRHRAPKVEAFLAFAGRRLRALPVLREARPGAVSRA